MSTSAEPGGRTEAISLADEDAFKQVLMDSVLGLWEVVNGLTRLKPSRRARYRVTIIGSARARPGTFGYEETKLVAAALAALGCDIITGGAATARPPELHLARQQRAFNRFPLVYNEERPHQFLGGSLVPPSYTRRILPFEHPAAT